MSAQPWTVVRADHGGRPLLVRFRQFDPGMHRAAYPDRLNVFWTMALPDENGLAGPMETPRLERFETELTELVESADLGLLAAVLTSNGQREFVFQLRDVSQFLAILNSQPDGEDPFPITIHRYADPEWSYFDDVISNVRPR